MPSTRRSSRLQSKQKQQSLLHSLTRKINNLSPNKKKHLKSFVKKLKQTRKEFKENERKKKAELKKHKKLYGAYSKSFRVIEKRLNPFTADKILKLTKEMDDYEKKIKKQRKELNKQKEELKIRLMIKEDYCSDVEAKIKNMLSPGWRKKNISPEVLDNLTSTRINEEVQNLRDDKQKVLDRINKLNEKLKTIEDNLRDLK